MGRGREKAGDAGGYSKIVGNFSRDGHGCEGVVFVAITRSRGAVGVFFRGVCYPDR